MEGRRLVVADGKRFDLTHSRERLAQPLPANVISCHTNFVFTTPHQNPFVGASGCCRLRQAIFAHNSSAWGLRNGQGSAPAGNRHSQLYERTSCKRPWPKATRGPGTARECGFNMLAVWEKAEELSALNECYRPFADRITQLAIGYQSKALLRLVRRWG